MPGSPAAHEVIVRPLTIDAIGLCGSVRPAPERDESHVDVLPSLGRARADLPRADAVELVEAVEEQDLDLLAGIVAQREG